MLYCGNFSPGDEDSAVDGADKASTHTQRQTHILPAVIEAGLTTSYNWPLQWSRIYGKIPLHFHWKRRGFYMNLSDNGKVSSAFGKIRSAGKCPQR